MSATLPSVQTPAQTIRIEFTDWQCGHHWQCPKPILDLTSKEQAASILMAMGCCISQPGSARAWVIEGNRFTHWYLTDDHASEVNSWAEMPLIVPCGADADFTLDEFEEDALHELLGQYGPLLRDWTPATPLWAGEVVLTRMTAEQLASYERPAGCPPFRVAAEPDLLAQARQRGAQYREDHAAYLAELAAEGHPAQTGGSHV